MHRFILLFGVSALAAAALGLPVGGLAGGLAFALGLAMIMNQLLSRPEENARLAPFFVLFAVTSVLWTGLAHEIRTIGASLLSSVVVRFALLVGAVLAILSPTLLLLANVVPEPAKPTAERVTARTRARVVEPILVDAPRVGERQAVPEDEFDFFHEERR